MNYSEAELYHHGIKGQKWGVRRFQNEDGTLTAAGRKHYTKELNKADQKRALEVGKMQKEYFYAKKTGHTEDKYESKRMKDAIHNKESYEKKIDSLIDEVNKTGATVKEKDIARGTTKYNEWLARNRGFLGLYYTNNQLLRDVSVHDSLDGMTQFVPGQKYKVKK